MYAGWQVHAGQLLQFGIILKHCACILSMLHVIRVENSAERAVFDGLLKRNMSPEFIIDFGLMYDALSSFQNFQNRYKM